MYYLCIIYLSVSGHLGCCHMLAIVNKCCNEQRHTCLFEFMFCVSLNKYPEVKLLGPSLSLVIAIVLKCILFHESIAIPCFLGFNFHEISFFIPTYSLCVFFNLNRVSRTQHMYGLCLLLHSATPSLLIVAFNPFTFKVVIDKYVFITKLLFIFLFPPFSSFPSPPPPSSYYTFNTSCNTSLVIMNSFSILLSVKFFISPSTLNNSLAG